MPGRRSPAWRRRSRRGGRAPGTRASSRAAGARRRGGGGRRWREVVCVTGDGAAGFHFMEMQSAAREGAKITVIVFAEGSWCMEVPNEQMLYGRTFGTEMGTVRWDVVARGLGCEGLYAASLGEVEAALANAREVAWPVVSSVRTDRTADLGVAPEAGMRFAEVYQGPM